MKANRYLRFRNSRWHYERRVPTRYPAFDDRGVIRFSLKTDGLDIARIRRETQVQYKEDFIEEFFNEFYV